MVTYGGHPVRWRIFERATSSQMHWCQSCGDMTRHYYLGKDDELNVFLAVCEKDWTARAVK